MAARRQLKMRTVFNLLGPLTNPAGASAQVVGVFDASVTELMAQALGELGVRRAFVVHGADGLDEISISGETQVAELRDGMVRSYKVEPEDFGLRRAPLEAIGGGDAKQNAEIIHKVLGRSMLYRPHGPHREIVLANAAAALVAAGRATDLSRWGAARREINRFRRGSRAARGIRSVLTSRKRSFVVDFTDSVSCVPFLPPVFGTTLSLGCVLAPWVVCCR